MLKLVLSATLHELIAKDNAYTNLKNNVKNNKQVPNKSNDSSCEKWG